ncbi:MAG: FAD-binding protein [Actinomycetota bacterium]|nr:FAD-binding protein [Actinomycetota bacterium]
MVAVVCEAERHGVCVRAVGSGHSWSDVAITPDFLMETHGLHRALLVDCLRDGVDASLLVRTEAGVRLQELNARLEQLSPPLALSNMGGWDAQTVAGVMATSTHGSGLSLGPICDQAVSIDVVGSGGWVYRVERGEGGPTDPERFALEHPDWALKRNDDWFHAVQVGMGCLGVIYAVTLQVVPFYHLTERRFLRKWSQVREDLRTGELLRNNRHVEIYVNVHRRKGDHQCLITTRGTADHERRGFKARHRNVGAEFIGSLQPLAPNVIDAVLNARPSFSPRFLDMALKALVDAEYTDKWYRVLNLGTANLMPAYSMEIGVPVDDEETHLRAVEEVLRVAAQRQKLGKVYTTSPISLRFVKASHALMSMMNGRDTMMLELIQLTRTEGGFELLAAYEEALYRVGGRPHWGQYNTLTGSHDLMRSMYPRYEDWLAVRKQLNASGVFDSPFTKRVGISRSVYQPA